MTLPGRLRALAVDASGSEYERPSDVAVMFEAADEIDRLRTVIHRHIKQCLPDTIDDLAAIIRKVDGGNSLGAGALAEAIIEAHKSELD